MASTLNRLPDGTIELTITIPWPDIVAEYNAQVDHEVSSAEVSGFRRGHAPRSLIEPKLDKSQLYSQALQKILPKAYSQAVATHSLKPILYPRISPKSTAPGQDWVFIAVTCELPPVTLPDYKIAIPKLVLKTNDQRLETILDYLSKNTQVALPSLLVEAETDRRLAALAENLTQLGLTTDKFLTSKNLTPQAHRAQIAQDSASQLTLELALAKIQSDHAHTSRKQTLDFLTSLV